MKKSDLKNGAIVETRMGKRYLKVDNTLISFKLTGEFLQLSNYSENLFNNSIYADSSSYDIMKINNHVVSEKGYQDCCSNALFEVENMDRWTWERDKKSLEK